MIEINGDLILNKDIQVFCHQTNCFATMGGGIAKQIAKLYPEVEASDYRYFSKNIITNELLMGTVLPIKTNDKRICMNMYAQYAPGPATVNLDDSRHRERAFMMCLDKIVEYLVFDKRFQHIKTIGFPKYIGCGLAGGDWSFYSQCLETFELRLNTLDQDNRDFKVYLVNFEKEN